MVGGRRARVSARGNSAVTINSDKSESIARSFVHEVSEL
jgi:hypothetical protein